ncbi:MAG: UDP-N-acetylmuramoyl-tripeptide--D-alanyl-D-alanine ligase [Deltaproteobacteria bacterium]|nr:MAG: UDP-N-acetylmuramoyl-tripeptide--D-alanyl-D-alanine ligase [Deltaproteobacteria bacterium]RLB86703.1 MAG: UDP-N-acetylmuramoyl-tripeptide--D-alanyl-D-alanine ligase [Deltaproteobacteria bacterium]
MAGGLKEIGCVRLMGVIDAILVAGNEDITFKGISTDSRTVQEGQLFWALRGERFDGHDFVEKALTQGAVGAVVEEGQAGRFSRMSATILAVRDTLYALGELARWWRKEHQVMVGAITGSVGKTTTKEMAAGILSIGHETLKTEGNFNNLIGLPLTLLRLEKRHGRAVVELGMNRPGEIARLTQIAEPHVGVITEVGIAHLEGLGSLLGVARAKLEMAQEMRSDGSLVINGDNEMLRDMAAQYGRSMLTFGLGRDNDVKAVDVRERSEGGSSFTLVYGDLQCMVNLVVPGLHNVMNGLAAAGLCIAMGERLDAIRQGLEAFTGLRGRFEIVRLGSRVTLVDDTYNANPVSLRAALDGVKGMVHSGKGLIVGLGDMLELGEESERAHMEAGAWVGELRPKLFVCIGRYAENMAEGALGSGMARQNVALANDTNEMADRIEACLRKGDVILIKGSRKVGLDKVREMLVQRMGQASGEKGI